MRKKLTIRQSIRVYLAERDMTQGRLAAELGMAESRLSMILSGKATPSLDEGLRIEDFTGIPARDFLPKAP